MRLSIARLGVDFSTVDAAWRRCDVSALEERGRAIASALDTRESDKARMQASNSPTSSPRGQAGQFFDPARRDSAQDSTLSQPASVKSRRQARSANGLR
jgi:hypothetical protein